MKRTLFLLSLLIGWTLQSAAQVEGKSVKVKGQGIYCGEVEMDVTQGADGKYYLYDSKRKICTLIGASLPSLDDLAANGTLRDYIRTEEDGPADDEEYIKEVLDADGIKATITYEKGGAPLVDAHWGMMRVYDFYKNVFGRDSYDMTGIGIDKGMRIAYLTLTKYCSSETDFSTISECWQQASEELYGKDSAETQAVIRAWAAVGIGNADYTGIDEINGQTTASAIYYDLQGRMLQAPPSKGIYIKKSGKGHTQVKKFITQ